MLLVLNREPADQKLAQPDKRRSVLLFTRDKSPGLSTGLWVGRCLGLLLRLRRHG